MLPVCCRINNLVPTRQEVSLALKVCGARLMVRELLPGRAHCSRPSRIHPGPQLYYSIYLHWLFRVATMRPARPPGEPRRGGDYYESVHWPFYVSAAAGHCGRRRPRVPSFAGRMFPSVCCRAAQPSWLKGCVHLVPLMGVISGSGSKHSGYKIKHECIKVMPGACLLPVLLSAERKSEIEKRH